MTRFLFCLALLWINCSLDVYHAQKSDLDVFYPRPSESYGTYAVEFAEGATIPASVKVKYRANGWTYVLAERNELYELLINGAIIRLYREPALSAALLDDSMRHTHFVNQVHQGLNLETPFTGQGVIMGYVDNGLDVRHYDFRNSDGTTRVLRFWNQGQSNNFRTPAKYGYGRVYTNVDINSNFNIVGNINQSSHGTTVTGMGSGNALANGRNKGVAPNCNIIAVRTNFSAPSWTLTVAEGVDYIFSVADSLGMPAVVNLSLGTPIGSHDAKDPAGLYIDSLLNQKSGRIVVCAAGNSGAWPAYHVRQELSTDTNFVWLIPNPALPYGGPGVYFDLWADTTDIQNMHFAFGADAPGPVYRGNTTYKQVNFLNQLVQTDTIYGVNNDVIGTVIYQGQVVGPNYNLQAIVFTDSLDYRIRFLVTGAGTIDLWSSAQSPFNGSNLSSEIPDTTLYPEFTKYMMPDTLQSVWSSWICSDQVISVGNIHNRKNYIDVQNNVYPPGGGTIPSGILSVNSSKGPNRQGNVKPDVVATGDMSLAARVVGLAYPPSSLDIGGLHVRNGGTSMASPVVAGIAALYLEKCPKSTWQDFKNDLIAATFQDSFTGNNLPNYAYGNGKVHALNTLLQTEMNPQISGNTVLCNGQTQLQVSVPNLQHMVWNTGDTAAVLQITQPGTYYGFVTNLKGCKNNTDTVVVVHDTIPPLATGPEDISVSCPGDVPFPDVSLVTNVSDDCNIQDIIHLSDVLITNGCSESIQRTYRVTDISGNITDLVQIISIIQGTVPATVDNDMTLEFSHGCGGVFYDLNNSCEQKFMVLDANGNNFDYDATQLIIFHDFVNPLPQGVQAIPTPSSGYYEISDTLNTFRISKKMFTIIAPGTYNVNGGVKVRFYYDANEFDPIINDPPNIGTISNFGWFKASYDGNYEVVEEMSPSSPLLASAQIIYPTNSGTEQGMNFVEFLVNSFSTFGFFASTQMTPLPVTLTDFSVKCNYEDLQLTWTTASEFESSHFVVEHSRNGLDWNEVLVVEGAGTTNQSTNYSVSLPKNTLVHYYRLKQIDLNGSIVYFGPIAANCEGQDNTWTVYPNPGSDLVNVELFSSKSDGLAHLVLIDLEGRVIQEHQVNLVKGRNELQLQVADLAHGIYMLQLRGSEKSFLPIKIAVQR
jgi:hypothetical protein